MDFFEFVSEMLFKLNKNAHKDTPSSADIYRITALLMREVAEFLEQYEEDRASGNVISECADIANFAFLLYVAVIKEKYDGLGDLFGCDVGPGSEVDDCPDDAEAERRRA